MATAQHGTLNLESLPSAKKLRVAVVVSGWNASITENLYQGALHVLAQKGCTKVHRIDVPGSFELIYGCKKAVHGGFDAVVALGSVIRGETAHFDYMCQAVSNGIKDLNLLGISPVIFGVLTDDTIEQAQARSGGVLGNKGAEAAAAAIEMAHLSI
ncbi:MAG: 6,7-dimethyl-8-ribityllumazine synthase [Bacteroidetes bacterium]|nr:6,7-dimethyl-8-ribityllumazine synthase [Bacteroidota bacterium]MDA0888326.1 6,7-dimethyl-8-ribityllumazine synthase [Bacteroidota bacterium]MDA1084643.1 6,7-dimethyl-8-ribityllumazine synthase [Bacteroidota bacterium]